MHTINLRKDPISELQIQSQTPNEIPSVETVERPPQNSCQLETDLCRLRQPPKSHPLSLHILALLIPFSTLGTLARLGLQALAAYEGGGIFSLAYAQAIGCLMMGLTLRSKDSVSRFYPPLYTAITTGFCGSLTTFSGWELDVFEAWTNTARFHRSGFQNFIDGTGRTFFTLSISLASVAFGEQLAAGLSHRLPRIPPPNHIVQITITVLSIASYLAVFPAYFLLPTNFRHQATAALLFAFPGTLTRYLLSVHLNTLVKALPFGTFTANSAGTALLGGFTVLKNISHSPLSPGICSILQGLSDGYCGCLTTVSTFAVEVRSMKGWRGFWYVLASWSVGQLLLLTILGASFWTGRAKEQMTCTFN
ncbi:CrcB-like protein-domain-containing protein [Collybia nuda]|uniref:CrcB-like protein-domain-containing protein n=1 Tax=Collybia nuda TaxID=64659 RepID=A0A9P5YAU9_9AGAR|nr:CrcB-like protein-domain-containing protein [Collybia nuda]